MQQRCRELADALERAERERDRYSERIEYYREQRDRAEALVDSCHENFVKFAAIMAEEISKRQAVVEAAREYRSILVSGTDPDVRLEKRKELDAALSTYDEPPTKQA